MKMKKMAYILFLLLIPLFTWGQLEEPIDQSILMNKKWVLRPSQKRTSYLITEFGEKEVIDTMVTEVGTASGKTPYYLSDKRDFIYQSEKLGNKTGKYIIILQKKDKTEEVSAFQILEANDSLLVLKNMNNNSLIEYKVE